MSNHLNTTADITVSIGTANTAGTWEYAPLREGIDTIVCDATILDISDLGGATTDNTPFSCVIALDGKPEVTRA